MTPETVTAEVEQYCASVRDALADLAPDVRDDLLEDLADHLMEVAAEGEGSLADRLGEPSSYAAELRSAAGLDVPEAAGEHAGLQDRILVTVRRAGAAGAQADSRLGRVLGYPKASQLIRALAPGWWVLRGWIVAQLVCAHRDGGWSYIPTVGNSALLGAAITVALIAVSVVLGRRTPHFADWPRRIAYAASLAVAVWGAVVLAPYLRETNYTIQSVPAGADMYGGGVSDLYVYDQSGNLVPSARIYDQNGNPLQIGVPDCTDGGRGAGSTPIDPSTGEPLTNDWSYPLCPDQTGPFQPPGPVQPGASTPSNAASPTAPATSATSTKTTGPPMASSSP